MGSERERIGQQAIRVEVQRQVVDRLKRKRSKFVCMRGRDKRVYHGGDERPVECWRALEWHHSWRHEYKPVNPEDWCDQCLKRQLAHHACIVEGRKLGAMRGALTRMCRASLPTEETP